jgi:hypothetical protein
MRTDIREDLGENMTRYPFRAVEIWRRVWRGGKTLAREGQLPRAFTASRGAQALEEVHCERSSRSSQGQSSIETERIRMEVEKT